MALNGPSMYADHVKGKRHLSKVSKLGPTYGFAFPNVPSSEPVAPTAFATTPLPPNLASTSAQTTPQRMSQSSQPQTHAELGPKRAEAPAEDPGDLQQLLLVKRPKRTTGGSGGGGAEETYCEACGTRCADALQWSLHVMGPRHSGARQREAGAEGGAGGGEAVALALQARYAEISPRPEQVVALANLVQALLQPLRAASWDLRPVGSYARGTLLREQPQVAELVLMLREPPPSRADAEACLERLRAQLQPLRVDGRTLTAELRGAEAALLVWPAGEPQGGRAVEIGLAWLAGGGREAGPAELRALCYRRLRAVAHVAWYEQQAALLPQAKPALRLFRHLRRIHGAWRDLLSAFALEVLVLTSIGPAQSLVVAVRRVLAALACGRLLPGGAGIQVPFPPNKRQPLCLVARSRARVCLCLRACACIEVAMPMLGAGPGYGGGPRGDGRGSRERADSRHGARAAAADPARPGRRRCHVLTSSCGPHVPVGIRLQPLARPLGLRKRGVILARYVRRHSRSSCHSISPGWSAVPHLLGTVLRLFLFFFFVASQRTIKYRRHVQKIFCFLRGRELGPRVTRAGAGAQWMSKRSLCAAAARWRERDRYR